jgi:hypothetical protein
MGDIQTYFYLGLISLIIVSLGLFFIGIGFAGLRRWARETPGNTPLAFWLIGSAVTVTLLVIVLGTAGVLYGFIRYGTS